MITRLIRVTLTMALMSGFAADAAAQRSRFDVAGGYQFAATPDQTLPIGWSASIRTPLSGAWNIVVEASGAYRTERDQDFGTDARLSIHTLGAGLRWSSRAETRVLPFLQLLTGVARASAQARVLDTDVGDTSTAFMLQPGAGVDIGVTETLGLVGQADYRRVLVDEEQGESGSHQFRLFVGVRVGL